LSVGVYLRICLYLEQPFPLAVATNSLIINRERIMNIMTFVSTELPTHCLYINVYAELPTQVERYFTTLRFIFFSIKESFIMFQDYYIELIQSTEVCFDTTSVSVY